MNKPPKGIILKIIKISFVISILFFLLKTLFKSWDQIPKYSFKINYALMILSIIILCISYFLVAFGWIIIIKKLKCELNAKKGLAIFFKAQISRYIPGTIWSYVGRIYLSKKEKIPKTITFISLVLEAIFLVSTSAIISFLILFPYLRLKMTCNYIIYFIITIILILLFHPRILNFLIRIITKILKKEETSIKIEYRDLLITSSMYILRGIFLGIGFVIFSNSIYPINFTNWPLLFGAALLSWLTGYLFIIAPGGMGIKEATIVFLLKPIMPVGIAIIIALSSRIWLILGETAALGLSILYKKSQKEKII